MRTPRDEAAGAGRRAERAGADARRAGDAAGRRVVASLLAAALAAALVVRAGGAAHAEPEPRPERVVLVVLGGGVRAKEMLGRPDLCPTIRAIGAAGIASDGWRAGGADPVEGTKAILCGRDGVGATVDRTRPAWPTVFEYARKGLALGPADVWLASFADGEALDLAASDHAEFGAPYAASVAVGDGPFGEPMKAMLSRFGRPNPTSARSWELLEGLRAATAKEASRRLGAGSGAHGTGATGVTDAETSRLERALLEEVDRRSRGFSGPAGLDARAVRAAITVLRVFRPRLLVVRLGQADAARESVAAYEEVLRRDDAEIARLRGEIASDPALRSTTTLLVVADVGRDAAKGAAGGLDRVDGSSDVTTVAFVGEGPGVRRGATPRSPRAVRDLCPTIGRLLGFPTTFAEGRARDDLVR